MNRLGIEQGLDCLSSDNEVQPGIDGERDAFHDNLSVMRRMLTEFLPKAMEAYARMNEFFQRKPISTRKVEELQNNLVAARLKIIELLQFLKSDNVISKETIESVRDKEQKAR